METPSWAAARPLAGRRTFWTGIVAVAAAVASILAPLATPSPAAAYTTTGARVGFAGGGPFLWMSDADLARELDAMAASGARWLRLDFDWPSIEPTQGNFNWRPTDRVVDAAVARGLSVLALPTYTPSWARAAGTTSGKYPPSDPADFANFVRLAATRYSSRINWWEIWNEPNTKYFWKPAPDPARYVALLRAAHTAIRSVDSDAVVISGGLSPAVDSADGLSISPITFVSRMYAAGAQGAMEAVAVHPYSYPAMPLQAGTESWNTFLRLPLVHDVMAAHGDGAKKIWLTEYGAPTGTASSAVSEATQAQLVTAAIDAADNWSWAGPLFWYGYRDQGTDLANRENNFGLVHRDFTPKPAWTTFVAALADTTAPTRKSKPNPRRLASLRVATDGLLNRGRFVESVRDLARAGQAASSGQAGSLDEAAATARASVRPVAPAPAASSPSATSGFAAPKRSSGTAVASGGQATAPGGPRRTSACAQAVDRKSASASKGRWCR